MQLLQHNCSHNQILENNIGYNYTPIAGRLLYTEYHNIMKFVVYFSNDCVNYIKLLYMIIDNNYELNSDLVCAILLYQTDYRDISTNIL